MIEAFVRYAADFEKAYQSRDFALLEPHFHEDAAYEVHAGGPEPLVHAGRAAVLDYLERVTEGFDLQFDARKLLRVDGPTVVDDRIVLHGVAVYTLEASDERLYLSLKEEAHFRDERIARLVDFLTPGAVCEIRSFVEKYPGRFDASLLGPAAGS